MPVGIQCHSEDVKDMRKKAILSMSYGTPSGSRYVSIILTRVSRADFYFIGTNFRTVTSVTRCRTLNGSIEGSGVYGSHSGSSLLRVAFYGYVPRAARLTYLALLS